MRWLNMERPLGTQEQVLAEKPPQLLIKWRLAQLHIAERTDEWIRPTTQFSVRTVNQPYLLNASAALRRHRRRFDGHGGIIDTPSSRRGIGRVEELGHVKPTRPIRAELGVLNSLVRGPGAATNEQILPVRRHQERPAIRDGHSRRPEANGLHAPADLKRLR